MAIRPQALRRRSFASYLSERLVYKILGPQGWPVWLGGILLGLLNILFFAWAHKPFTIYTGFLNWGQHLYSNILNLDVFGKPGSSPLAETTSVGDIGLFLGALIAALLAGEFRFRVPSRGLDYIEGAVGGFLMALGVVFAVGCNFGGFFSAITSLSFNGYLMFLGLLIGGFLGSLYVNWRTRKELEEIDIEKLEVEETAANNMGEGTKRVRSPYRRILSTLVVLSITALLLWYIGISSGGKFVGILLMGIIVGLVLQRSRFCFATAFRDLLMGGGEFGRSIRLQIGIALGIIVGASGVFVLKYMGYVDPGIYINPAGWSNILGGVLFGIGMVIAGGCGSGSLWRAAEGNVKSFVALLATILSYAPLRAYVNTHAPWIYGPKVSLTAELGWAGGLGFVYLTMISWILILLYIEYRRGVRSGQAI